MKISRFRTVIGLCAILAFPWCAMFAGNAETAVLRASGAVSLNGTGAPDTTALLKGDHVQTANDGIVTISSPGSSVIVPSNSQVEFKGNAVNVTAGTARISTTKGMAAQSDSYLISPASGKANYEVSRVGNDLSVHATNGALKVNAGGKTYAIAEGKTQNINAVTGSVAPAKSASGVQGGSIMPKESMFKSPADGLNYCYDAFLCHKRSGVSGFHACKCNNM